MTITWDIPLIFLSVLIAMVGSFTALTHAQRMRQSSGRQVWSWMLAGSVTLGMAIWSMHFIGMLAFHLPIPIGYDLPLTVLSALPAIAAALLGFYVLQAHVISRQRIAISGLLMGIGISVMHYTGMAALKMFPPIRYDPFIFTLSIVIAVCAAWGALLMMYQGERVRLSAVPRFMLGGAIMGVAISGMHYTAMLGVDIQPGSLCMADTLTRIEPHILAMMVSVISLLWFGGGILATLFDQRMAHQHAGMLEQLRTAHADLEQTSGQKAMEMTQSLRESEERMRLLLESVAEGIYGVDTDGRCTFINPSALRMLGYEHASEFIGQSVHRMIHHTRADGKPCPVEECGMFHALRANTEVSGDDETFWRKDGSPFSVEYWSHPMRRDGVLSGAVVTFFDITERKRMEQQLAQSELELRAIVEAEPECVKLLAADGTVLKMNPAGLAMLEADTPEQIVGQKAQGLLAPGSHDDFVALMQRVFAGESAQLQFEVIGLKGTHRWLETNAVPMRDINGRIYATLGVTRDITERKRSEEVIRNSESKLRMLMDNAADAVFVADAETEHWAYTNDRAAAMLGYSREELAGMGMYDLVPPDFRETYRQSFREAASQGAGKVWNYEIRLIRKDGSRVPIELNMVKLPDGNLYGSCRDITERKRIEQELRVAATAFEAQEGMLITDANAVILRVNRTFSRLTGYSNEEVMGKKPSVLKSGRQDKEFYRAMWDSLQRNRYWEGEVWNRRKNGEIYPEWLVVSGVTTPSGKVTHYVGSFTDITERKVAEAEIHRMAFFDPLTGLPNRRLLLDRLEHAQASGARSGIYGAIMFLDLDNFKTLNDTQGHDVGDQLLGEVARRLTACVRAGDTVARLGGDEFVVILEELSDAEPEAASLAEAVAEKILTLFGQPYLLGDYEYRCTSSIGVTLFNDGSESADELLKRADVAMYQAKEAGRNAIRFFDPAMQQAVMARASLETELRRAVEEGQMRLHYQAQVNPERRIIGAEVLLSWQHPVRGLVPTEQFIGIAEETGLIQPIGQWVLESACRQLKRWENDPLTRDLKLAVNVSARQFRRTDFVDLVREALDNSGANPLYLKLELTESLLLDDLDDVVEKISTLKEIGIGFALDDFGTGYSSLQYLKRLPLDQIKIDQSFVRDIIGDHGDRVMVLTMVDMGMNFEVDVIAEGVETEAQFNLLKRYGCGSFQGYLFGRPLPVDEFEDALRGQAR
ncbi:MAG: PAS domain S-box protein [Nitrosomonadales bacterium]|nr:PAS domain S-box protein [Nitrosomonadales bacterium]